MPGRTLRLEAPIDLKASFGFHRMGARDPTVRIEGPTQWRTFSTPDGAASLRLHSEDGRTFEAEAWGDGAEAVLAGLEGMLGASDRPEEFEPEHPVIRRLHRKHRTLRIPKTPFVFDPLVQIILRQRVRWQEAVANYRRLVTAQATEAPGDCGLLMPPRPAWLARIAEHEYSMAGVERKRADTIRRVAVSWRRVEEVREMSKPDAVRRLSAFRGVGPWTVASTLGLALGDADAVPPGDANLPHLVSWVLAGEPMSNDDRMFELLEPFDGHRWRVVRLMHEAGLRAPRLSPKKKKGRLPGMRF